MKTKRGSRPCRRYPWFEWFCQSRFVLVRGIDYDIRTDLMIQQIRTHAGPKYFDCTVRITVADDSNSMAVEVFATGPKKRKQLEKYRKNGRRRS